MASVAALMLEAPPAVAQMAAPTVNLIERVLMVKSVVPQGKAGTINVVGTIFSIDIDHREYWLTAKHILTGAKHPPYGSVTEKSVSLSILNPNAQGEQWESVNFSVIDPGKDVDIVVLAASEPLMRNPATVTAPPDAPGTTVFFIGFDCEFLGYPSVVGFTWHATVAEGGKTYWLPFVKHCTVSGANSEGLNILFLDGINNEGFSGGPVIYGTGAQQKIIGVISSFISEPAEVMALVPAQNVMQPKEPKETANVNSGFIIAFSISYAVDAIHKSPIGPLRKEN
jgi:hypothetical protein